MSDVVVYKSRRWPLYLVAIVVGVVLFLQASFVPQTLTGQKPFVLNLAFVLDMIVTVLFVSGFLVILWSLFFGVKRLAVEYGELTIQFLGRSYRYSFGAITEVSVKETTQRYKGRTTDIYWIRFRAPDQRKFALGVEGETGKQVYEKFKTLTTHL